MKTELTKMATGAMEELTESMHEAAYEYACTICIEKKGSYSEATNYCADCDAYYCRPCLQYICDHGSLGKAKMEMWGKPTCPSTRQRCRDHSGNMIQLYCGDDNEVGCHVCVAENHQHCSQMKYISKLVTETETKQQLKAMQSNIKEIQSGLMRAQTNRSHQKETLESIYSERKKEIQEFCREIVDILHDLEEKSIADLKELMKTISDHMEDKTQKHDHLQNELDLIQTRLDDSSDNKADLFIIINQGYKTLEEGKNVLSGLTDITEPLQFQPNSEIETCLLSLSGLGQLAYSGQQEISRVNAPYAVQTKRTFSVRSKDDIGECNIVDICQMPDGTFVISDGNNACLKQLDSSYQVIGRCSFSAKPYGVCRTNDREVAVTIGTKTVQFVSVDGTMSPTRAFTPKHLCVSLACSNDNLYITNRSSTIYEYSMSGTCQREMTFDDYLYSSMLSLPYFSRRICASPDGSLLYVTNPNKNILLTIDTNGKVVNTFMPVKSRGLRDICVDGSGNVFVCGRNSNDIIQVEASGGKKLADVVPSSGSIKGPWSLCFDTNNSKLLVACWQNDECHALNLIQ